MSKRKRTAKQQARSPQKALRVTPGIKKRDSSTKSSLKARHTPSTGTSTHLYTDSQHILFLGEGNFSFARAVVRTLEYSGRNVVATAYDSEETVSLKYEVDARMLNSLDCNTPTHLPRAHAPTVLQEGPHPVTEITEELRDCDATVLFDVDAANILRTLQACVAKM